MFELIDDVLKLVMPTINKLVPDPQAQAQAKVELQTVLTSQLSAVLDASKSVMVADSSQDDKYTKRARPSVVYWSMGFATLIATAGAFGHAQPMLDALKQIPSDLWTLMTVGIGAFGVSRGVEKGITAFTGSK